MTHQANRVSKIHRGRYLHHRTGRLIVHTEALREGPRGGELGGWEVASRDDRHGAVIDGPDFPRLSDAVAYLDRADATTRRES